MVGRLRFFKAYKEALDIGETVDDAEYLQDAGSDHPQWVARDYLRELMSRGAAPQPALLKQNRDGTLALRSRCPSDAVAHAIAAVLPRLTHVLAVDVSDNQLGDEALAALVAAVEKSPGVKSLDLSRNKVDDEASAAVRSLLGGAHPLEILRLSDADVDDGECATLTEALEKNSTLRQLDLSHNALGADEARNLVDPDTTTGPEQIAAALAGGKLALTSLDLSWNFVRADSAEQLGNALKHVKNLATLKLAYPRRAELSCLGILFWPSSPPRNIHVAAAASPRPTSAEDLHGRSPRNIHVATAAPPRPASAHLYGTTDQSRRYNGFGDEPTQVLAAALESNVSLTSLDLSYNNARRPRGYSAETGRGTAAAATWTFRGGESRRRRGCHVDIPWRRVAATPRLRGGSSAAVGHARAEASPGRMGLALDSAAT